MPQAPCLLAPPSLFASSLLATPNSQVDAAQRVEQTLCLASGAGLVAATEDALKARFGPSPDDKVIAARSGTALAGTPVRAPKR